MVVTQALKQLIELVLTKTVVKFQLKNKLNMVNKEHVEQAQAAYTGVSNRLEQYWKLVGGFQ